MSAWSVPSVESTIRYQESQVSLVVVVDWIFTSGVDCNALIHWSLLHKLLFFFLRVCICAVGLKQ